jgi:hypothetical protein
MADGWQVYEGNSAALAGARECIMDWCDAANAHHRNVAFSSRFFAEATSSLPIPATYADLDAGLRLEGAGPRGHGHGGDAQLR